MRDKVDLGIVNNMAPPMRHVVHADNGEDDGQNANPRTTSAVIESAAERWNRRKDNVKS